MPYIQVYMVEGRVQEQREKLAKAITDATVEILKVNKGDICHNFWYELLRLWFRTFLRNHHKLSSYAQ